MENAVTAIALNDSTLVTTSTGIKDIDDSVTGYCTRLWQNGQNIKIIRDHYASVRCCEPFFLQNDSAYGFVTGGNDGKMFVYNSMGDKLISCETSPNVIIVRK